MHLIRFKHDHERPGVGFLYGMLYQIHILIAAGAHNDLLLIPAVAALPF